MQFSGQSNGMTCAMSRRHFSMIPAGVDRDE